MVIQSTTFTTIVLLASSTVFGEALTPDAKKRAIELWGTVASNETNGAPTMSKVRGLKDEERNLLQIYFRERLEGDRRFGLSGEGYLLKLAMVGDADARDRIVASWVVGLGAEGGPKHWQPPHDLLRLESPEAIAQIGELLYMNEEYQMPSDVGYLPPQSSALHVVLYTLQRAPAFDGPVRVWADELLSLRNGAFVFHKNALDLVRVWYRENEALLKKGDFQAVQPGRLPVEAEATQPVPAEPVVNVEPVPNAPATPTVKATHELAPASSEWSFAAIAAGCLVLLGGLVFFWKRRPG